MGSEWLVAIYGLTLRFWSMGADCDHLQNTEINAFIPGILNYEFSYEFRGNPALQWSLKTFIFWTKKVKIILNQRIDKYDL